MKLTKQIARNLVFPTLMFLKYDRILLRKSKKQGCIINFHGVRKSTKEVFNNRHLPVKDFEKIIVHLKNNYKIVPLKELFELHRSKNKSNKKTISLTFDDGYKNNFDIVLPILKKYNVPATYYIVTEGLVNRDFFMWPDPIDIFNKYYKKDISLNGYLFKTPAFYNEDLKISLSDYLKTCGEKTVELVKALIVENPEIKVKMKEFPEYTDLIYGDELSHYKDEALVEFGSHTHSHFCLEYVNTPTTIQELEKSKKILEDTTGKTVISIAFPDGSYTKETLKLSKEIGYKNIVAVDYKYNENNSDDSLLSRFTISNSTTFESNVIRLAREFDKYGF